MELWQKRLLYGQNVIKGAQLICLAIIDVCFLVCVCLFVCFVREIISVSFIVSYYPPLVHRSLVKKIQPIKYICTKCTI